MNFKSVHTPLVCPYSDPQQFNSGGFRKQFESAALHLHFLGLVLMAIAMFMRKVVEVKQGIIHPVQRVAPLGRDTIRYLGKTTRTRQRDILPLYSLDIMPPSIISPPYYMHKFVAEVY